MPVSKRNGYAMIDPPEEALLGAGGDMDQVTVSVRVMGDMLDPIEVSRALGVEPSFTARKGDRRKVGDREVLQCTGVWYIQFMGNPAEWTLDEAIGALLDRLPQALSVWDQLALRYRLDLFCGLQMATWNRGVSLRPSVLRRVSDRHLELVLDLYFVGEEFDK